MFEEDWLMRQIKVMGEGIGVLFKKELSSVEFGEMTLANGKKVSRYQVILDYLKEKDYQNAFLLVNSLKYKMSVYDFNMVADWFIEYLEALPETKKESLTDEAITHYKRTLKELL